MVSASVKYAKRDRSGCRASKSGPFAIWTGVKRGCGSRMLAARTQSAFPFFVRSLGTSHVFGSAAAAVTLTKHIVAARLRSVSKAPTDSDAFHCGRRYARVWRKARINPRKRQRQPPDLERACESRGDRQLLERHRIPDLRQLPPGVAPTAIAPRWSISGMSQSRKRGTLLRGWF